MLFDLAGLPRWDEIVWLQKRVPLHEQRLLVLLLTFWDVGFALELFLDGSDIGAACSVSLG